MAGEYAAIALLSWFILGIGATIDIVGILLWLRKVRPNRCIGVRIKSMGDNEAVWYEVNEYAGKVLTVNGLFLVLFALLYFILPSSFTILARLLVFAVVFIISLGGAIFLCINRAKAFARHELGESGDFVL